MSSSFLEVVQKGFFFDINLGTPTPRWSGEANIVVYKKMDWNAQYASKRTPAGTRIICISLVIMDCKTEAGPPFSGAPVSDQINRFEPSPDLPRGILQSSFLPLRESPFHFVE